MSLYQKSIGLISAVLFVGTFSLWAEELDPSVQFDILQYRFLETIQQEKHSETLRLLGELRATGKPLGNEILFFESRALFETGDTPHGETVLGDYIKKAGPSGANYSTAIGMMSDLITRRDQERFMEAERIRKEDAAKRQAQAYFDSLVNRGTVSRINSEWGYIVIQKTESPISDGRPLFLYTATSKKILLQGVKDISSTEISATVPLEGKAVVGMTVYSEPSK